MNFKETIKYINFYNDSELPLNIDSWIDGSNVLKTITVEPGQKLIIHSSEGEWYLHSMLQSEKKREIWRQKGLDKVFIIGKFRSQPCYLGKYAWLDYSCFECVYSELLDDNENKITGLMTFSLKK